MRLAGLALTALALIALTADAEEEKKSRFDGWDKAQFEAHRTRVAAKVKARAIAWYEARSKVGLTCPACNGNGTSYLGGSCRPCNGVGVRMDPRFDARTVDRFCLLYVNAAWDNVRKEYWHRLRTEPLFAVIELVKAATVREVRVHGDLVQVMAVEKPMKFARYYRLSVDDERPGISWWVKKGDEWRVTSVRDFKGLGADHYPDHERPNPRQEPEALELLAKTRALLHPAPLSQAVKITFNAKVKTPVSKRPASFKVECQTDGRIEIEVRSIPKELKDEGRWGEFGCKSKLRSLIDAYVLDPLFPISVGFHVELSESTRIELRGFDASVYLDRWQISLGKDGLPAVIIDTSPRGECRITPTFKKKGDRHVLVSAARNEYGQESKLVIKPKQVRDLWLPARFEVTDKEGQTAVYSLSGFRVTKEGE